LFVCLFDLARTLREPCAKLAPPTKLKHL
jgi:hypothetical protein